MIDNGCSIEAKKLDIVKILKKHIQYGCEYCGGGELDGHISELAINDIAKEIFDASMRS